MPSIHFAQPMIKIMSVNESTKMALIRGIYKKNTKMNYPIVECSDGFVVFECIDAETNRYYGGKVKFRVKLDDNGNIPTDKLVPYEMVII